MVAAILRARDTGEGSHVEIAQADAAAAMDWLRSETWMTYRQRDEDPRGVTGEDDDRRAPGTAGMRDGVRYQFYATKDDHHVLFMASERVFWSNFCRAVGRPDLFERWPGQERGDHASGNAELREELRRVFLSKTADEWVALAADHNTAIAPVNTPKSLQDDPQFRDRFSLYGSDTVGSPQLPSPLHFRGGPRAQPTKAPELGQHTDEVLGGALGYDNDRIDGLRRAGAIY